MRHLTFILSLLLTPLALPAQAQRWTSGTSDDGVWFFADAAPPDRGIELHCGGRSPQNRPVAENPAGEPMVTPTNQITLSIAAELVTITDQPRNDIALIVDGREFWLPDLRFSEFEDVHEAPLDINDPVFAALRGGRQVTLQVDDQTGPAWALRGSSAAIRKMAKHCVPRWQDPAGPPLPFTQDTRPTPRVDPDLWVVEVRATDNLVAATATAPTASLRIGCVRPNTGDIPVTERLPLLGPVTVPSRLSVAVATLSLPPPPADGPGPHEDVQIALDGAQFPLPVLTHDGGAAWRGEIAADDLLLDAMTSAQTVRLLKGDEPRAEFGTKGLAAAIDRVQEVCAGDTFPTDLLAGAVIQPAFDPMQAIDRSLADWCPSGPALDPDAILLADLDADGRNDAVVDASGYTCDGMRPSCGAAFCSAYVFLSSRGDEFPLDYLTIGASLTQAEGQPALHLEYAMSTCSNPFVLEGCTSQTLVFRNGRAVAVAGD